MKTLNDDEFITGWNQIDGKISECNAKKRNVIAAQPLFGCVFKGYKYPFFVFAALPRNEESG